MKRVGKWIWWVVKVFAAITFWWSAVLIGFIGAIFVTLLATSGRTGTYIAMTIGKGSSQSTVDYSGLAQGRYRELYLALVVFLVGVFGWIIYTVYKEVKKI